jgi:serine/threonine-protein kinase
VSEAPQQFGKYRIFSELGRGGFATVYRAVDTTLDREVALKILYPQMLADPTFVQRFRQEARTLAALRHPQVVTVYEVGEAAGRLFIAMELAHGPSLAQSITRRGRVPWAEALALLGPVAEALDYAHGQGIVHRDLKPANVLLDKQRGPLLTDFGFARLMGESSVVLSMSGGVLGTPGYIAPEVWDGSAAEAPADIYALGCIVAEMLTGEALFRGQTPMQVMRAHDRGPAFPDKWPDDVPPGVQAALHKALARDPAARYPTGMALWHALNDLEARAREAREARDQAALVAQWRAEAEAALAAGELSAARMAIGRWLALAPDDPAALAAKARLDRLESPPGGQGGSSRSRKIPLWALALGGLAALVVVAGVARAIGLGGGGSLATPTSGGGVSLISTATAASTTAPPTARAAATSTSAGVAPAATTPTDVPPRLTPTPIPPAGIGKGQIAFSSDRDEPRGEIYLINADGSGLIRLTNSSGGDDKPDWSPDGSRIAFASDHDGDYEIYVMNADGSGRAQLTDNTTPDLDPSWSPDGRRIVFQSERDSSQSGFEVGACLTVIRVSQARGERYPRMCSAPSGRASQPFGPQSTDNPKVVRSPLSVQLPSSFDIYIMNADGSEQTRLTDDPGYELCPAWSPNGKYIAFLGNQNGAAGIYLVKPDGSGQTLLAENGVCPAWSPDSRQIAFVGADDIYVMNADGSNQINLTNNPAFDYGPTWSPDGSQIAFWSKRDDNSEIYVMNADGSKQTNVTNSPAGDSMPAWRPRP